MVFRILHLSIMSVLLHLVFTSWLHWQFYFHDERYHFPEFLSGSAQPVTQCHLIGHLLPNPWHSGQNFSTCSQACSPNPHEHRNVGDRCSQWHSVKLLCSILGRKIMLCPVWSRPRLSSPVWHPAPPIACTSLPFPKAWDYIVCLPALSSIISKSVCLSIPRYTTMRWYPLQYNLSSDRCPSTTLTSDRSPLLSACSTGSAPVKMTALWQSESQPQITSAWVFAKNPEQNVLMGAHPISLRLSRRNYRRPVCASMHPWMPRKTLFNHTQYRGSPLYFAALMCNC